ncbi:MULTISPECIES: ABC transporter permease [Brevibacillus]|uniref:ABC transporter permease n=1 Tax=Brevibacillus TaxID=55080 RepID=UPI000D1004DA|nr:MULTISPECIES: ABC transporter permease [Brevibacillus]PSJ67946.1 peptide ABC transporter permease [Brevibacillus brevis]RED35410.1 peptide/nickel transport system permease protein [Brevibacillus brevis]TQK63733.1 peptide/nickel transport system permease protein [Brevibacillus sp. AG162]VEF89480.1 Oligopeptide transport system permease protein oppB [Brevibacillus brevis]GEC87925.1 peptide ABC transporter permease [Brevibacillus brevis]
MSRYLLKRILMMVLTLWIIVTLTFSLMHMIPGDPFASESDQLPEQILLNLRAKYNLDEPLPMQYILYLKSLVMLDLGPSIKSETRGVNDMIKDGFGASALIGLQAIAVALFFGLLFGTIAALNRNTWIDYAAMVMAVLGIAVPSFIMAPLLINYLAIKWPLFPVATLTSWKHSVLPSLALAFGPLAIITRYMRTSMIDVMNQNYIRTAEAKGIPTFLIVVKHGIRNAILPIVTFMGPLIAGLLTGTFVVEKIFAVPGIGKYFVDGIFNRDYPVILGTTVFYSAILVLIIFLIDLAYMFIDPRIKLSSRGR